MVFLRWATRALIKAQLLLIASLIRQPRKRRIKSEFAFFQFSSRFFSSHFDVKVKLKVKVKSSYFTSVARNSHLTNKLEADYPLGVIWEHSTRAQMIDCACLVYSSQAMIDVASAEGWLATALRCMHLVQMVVQGRWLHDCTLLTLPCVDPGLLRYFRVEDRSLECLPELLDAVRGQRKVLHSMLEDALSAGEINEVQRPNKCAHRKKKKEESIRPSKHLEQIAGILI